MTLNQLRDALIYDGHTGHFTWAETGDRADHLGHGGYMYISLDGIKEIAAHRIAYLLVTGEPLPKDRPHIDHENHIRSDNRWTNLRPSNPDINSKNRRMHKHNKTGIYGVRWHPQRHTWHAYLTVRYKLIDLGYHNDFFEACCARRSAEHQYGYHSNHGH